MQFQLLKQSDDPMGTVRISCGYDAQSDMAYIVYRGDLHKVQEAMDKLNQELQKQKEEAPADPRGDTIPGTAGPAKKYKGTWKFIGEEKINEVEIQSDKISIDEIRAMLSVNLFKMYPTKQIQIISLEEDHE